MLTKIFSSSKVTSQLSNAVSDVLLRFFPIKISYCEHTTFLVTFRPKSIWGKRPFLANFSTLVNNCWPHVSSIQKLILETWKGRLELLSPSISRSQTQYSQNGGHKPIFCPYSTLLGLLPSNDQIASRWKPNRIWSNDFWSFFAFRFTIIERAQNKGWIFFLLKTCQIQDVNT